MDSTERRQFQRMLKIIEAARKGEASLVNVADSLHFSRSGLENMERAWDEQFGSHVLTLESAGLASAEQQLEMGESFSALKTRTLDALETMVKKRMEEE